MSYPIFNVYTCSVNDDARVGEAVNEDKEVPVVLNSWKIRLCRVH